MFTQFALHKLLLKALRGLDFEEPTAVQEAVVPLALERVDLRVTAETGSGKTVAFVLPLLHHLLTRANPGTGTRALILVPTRELAKQVTAVCEKLAEFTNLKVGMVSGGENFGEQMQMFEQRPDVVIATPGRLIKHLDLGTPDFADLDVLVLDEADRMLDMGFSENVMNIVEQCNPDRQTLLFSATLGDKALRGMADAVLREPESVNLSEVREQHSHITHQMMLADDPAHKQAILLWLVQYSSYDKMVVFTNSRAQADTISGFLIHHRQRVGVLHGDIDQVKRDRVMSLMRSGAFKVLVATDVASRGLDIEGVDIVINFDMARRGDIYLHRTGRTGRAGRQGLAISLISPQEWNLMASVSRYLHLNIERRVVEGLKGSYHGPKKVRASGKAAGSKKKKPKKKLAGSKVKSKKRVK